MKGIDLVAEARTFAKEKHGKQLDKNKEPYFNHLAAVSLGVRALGGSIPEIAAAYLHDVVEDVKEVSLLTLMDHGFPAEVVRIVWAVTKRTSEPQEEYLARIIATGEGAMRVKAADLLHNLRPDRLAQQPSYTRERLEKKYRPSLARLLMELGYLQTLADQEESLATNPIGSSTGYSYSTGSSTASDYAHKDFGFGSEESSKYYAPSALMVGDWPAKASAPIAKVADKKKAMYILKDGTPWASSAVRVRIWPEANYNRRKAIEKKKGNANWSPEQEPLIEITPIVSTGKELTVGSDKKNPK